MNPVIVLALKVSGYILVSLLVALLASPEFREFIQKYPEAVAYVPLVNVILATLAKILKEVLPEDNSFGRAL